MDNIIVITQNVRLDSLHKIRPALKGKDTLVFSTQLIFNNERQIIEKELNCPCLFKNFSDFMNDADYEHCDVTAFQGIHEELQKYYNRIKKIKNECVVERILREYPCNNLLLVCDDLGLDSSVWKAKGFKEIECDYYYKTQPQSHNIFYNSYWNVRLWLSKYKNFLLMPRHEAIFEGNKYIFYGSLNRIGYRFNIKFQPSSRIRSIIDTIHVLVNHCFGVPWRSKIIRMSTLHEAGINMFPDKAGLNLKLIQDGYLPPNYSSKYLKFNGENVEYFTWDVEGGRTFEYHGLKHRVIPFRNKLYIPEPSFPKIIKKVLCVASGAGDWTALKNRSDEDKMIEVFGRIAANFPDIEFIYRCHPVWVHPQHQGVNSINRAAEYIHWLNLPNLKISSNIPNAIEDGHFKLSFKRSSFEEDLKDVDIVFGEHSISMIDAAFKSILFCSVNVTGRRDFFAGISHMGFPHCESYEEICSLLTDLTSERFRSEYCKAINSYNSMTDIEDYIV